MLSRMSSVVWVLSNNLSIYLSVFHSIPAVYTVDPNSPRVVVNWWHAVSDEYLSMFVMYATID